MLIDAAYPIHALSDEGPLKNFGRPVLNLAEAGNAGASAALRRRHVILLEADPELTLFQIRERERANNRPHPKYIGWSREEIIRYYSENGPKYRAMVDALRPWAAGVLRLSRSDSTRHNVEAVAAFVRSATPEEP